MKFWGETKLLFFIFKTLKQNYDKHIQILKHEDNPQRDFFFSLHEKEEDTSRGSKGEITIAMKAEGTSK